ncbi:hypothetical protein [Streptomyces californicus]|uniref:hypothetical protein n=1 Tax=Streptomyces californicus TaxID=67351 RepID=UPI0010BD0157|nr:hypothetical protein [Streptomyces californicus]QRV57136.1 hypothetical protein I6J40_25345 [Streptomyces californicus]
MADEGPHPVAGGGGQAGQLASGGIPRWRRVFRLRVFCWDLEPNAVLRAELGRIALDIEDDPAAYTVDLIPADPAMFEVVREAEEADAAVQGAETRRRAAMTRAAKTLVGLGLTQAEAGHMLGVPHQRTAQLAPKASNKGARKKAVAARWAARDWSLAGLAVLRECRSTARRCQEVTFT